MFSFHRSDKNEDPLTDPSTDDTPMSTLPLYLEDTANSEAIFVNAEFFAPSPTLEAAPADYTLSRPIGDDLACNVADKSYDDLSLHPSDVDSQVLEHGTTDYDLPDDQGEEEMLSSRHASDSFVNVGVLMAQRHCIGFAGDDADNSSDTSTKHKSFDNFRMHTYFFWIFRLLVAVMVLLIQVAVQGVAWIRVVARRLDVAIVVGLAYLLGKWMGSLSCNYTLLESNQELLLEQQEVLITELLQGEHVDIQNETQLEPPVEQKRTLYCMACLAYMTVFFLCIFALYTIVSTLFRKYSQRRELKPKTDSKNDTNTIEFASPMKHSALPELHAQLLVLGCNKSCVLKDQVRTLVQVRQNLYKKMNRDDLRSILKEHGMSPSGLKNDLAIRLSEQWSTVPLPMSKKDMAKSLIGARRQLFAECKAHDLQRLLKENGMCPSGKKKELVQRVAESVGTIDVPRSC